MVIDTIFEPFDGIWYTKRNDTLWEMMRAPASYRSHGSYGPDAESSGDDDDEGKRRWGIIRRKTWDEFYDEDGRYDVQPMYYTDIDEYVLHPTPRSLESDCQPTALLKSIMAGVKMENRPYLLRKLGLTSKPEPSPKRIGVRFQGGPGALSNEWMEREVLKRWAFKCDGEAPVTDLDIDVRKLPRWVTDTKNMFTGLDFGLSLEPSDLAAGDYVERIPRHLVHMFLEVSRSKPEKEMKGQGSGKKLPRSKRRRTPKK
jgi:hypothetical protein